MANFWWGSIDEERKMRIVNWEKMTEGKEQEGLEFKEIRSFNQALLAKHIWRFIICANLLLSKVVKANIEKQDITKAKTPGNSSWFWKSVMSARGLIARGLRKRVGDGKTVNI